MSDILPALAEYISNTTKWEAYVHKHDTLMLEHGTDEEHTLQLKVHDASLVVPTHRTSLYEAEYVTVDLTRPDALDQLTKCLNELGSLSTFERLKLQKMQILQKS